MKVIIILVVIFYFLLKDDSRSEKDVRELFREKRSRVFIDKETGKHFLVSYLSTNKYTIKTYKSEKEENQNEK